MDPLTPLDTLCRIILRGREYESQTASDYDRGEDPDNIDDESVGTLSVALTKRYQVLMRPPLRGRARAHAARE